MPYQQWRGKQSGMWFQLSDELYALFRTLIQERSGLSYPEHKRDDLVHGIDLAMKSTGHRTPAELYADVVSGDTAWETLLAHLTIGETSFFRNRPQFDALRDQIVPDLVERRSVLRTMRIWSAGCATGEEPYSLAILLRESIPDIDTWHISILATDINPNFLVRAREASYGSWSFRDTPETLRQRYFVAEHGRWRLKSDYRTMVTFTRLNLTEPVYPSITNGTMALDIILCRNVTIYFDEPTTRKVVDRLYRALSPGGWLVVGHAEPQAIIYHQFEVYNFPNTVIYRKQLDAPLFSSDPSREAAVFVPPVPVPPPMFSRDRGVPEGENQQKHPRSPRATLLPSVPNPVPPGFSVPTPGDITPRMLELPAHVQGKDQGTRSSAPSPLPVSSAINSLWNNVKGAMIQGNKAAAEQFLNEILAAEPDHVDARVFLGRICADRGAWECAHQHCEIALQREPLSIEAHYLLAQVYEQEEHYEDALNEYRRVVFLDRRFILGMIGMANIWRQMGHSEDARRVYRNALKQLATMSPSTPVPGADGATASELTSFVTRQLQKLG